jgi:hypothetical protein
LIPLILIILFLIFAGIFAITQETDGEVSGEDDLAPDELVFDFLSEEAAEMPPEWIPPGPPRWFRSNAGGMTLAEIPSRLAALRNKYALVVDYVPPDEIDPRLLPYYNRHYAEIRILYKEGRESRRQWLFRDESGIVRLNAVFYPPPDEIAEGRLPDEYQTDWEEAESAGEHDDDFAGLISAFTDDESAEAFAAENLPENFSDDPIPDPASESVTASKNNTSAPAGFIEIFNGKAQIAEDHWLYEDGGEFQIFYSYNENTLVRAEAYNKPAGLTPGKAYTDSFRYNRSFSLRRVERLYHEEPEQEPARFAFPYRVLEAAKDQNFMTGKLYLSSGFFGSMEAGEGFRMVFDTDDKGRILTQTLLNSGGEALWVIKNTWSGDRIIAAKKTEGKDEKLTEYEYDGAGKLLVQRDFHNGNMERVVHVDGGSETEELYMNGVMVMKAYWEDGRKISEERVKRQ